jgi:hypothetical protein
VRFTCSTKHILDHVGKAKAKGSSTPAKPTGSKCRSKDSMQMREIAATRIAGGAAQDPIKSSSSSKDTVCNNMNCKARLVVSDVASTPSQLLLIIALPSYSWRSRKPKSPLTNVQYGRKVFIGPMSNVTYPSMRSTPASSDKRFWSLPECQVLQYERF